MERSLWSQCRVCSTLCDHEQSFSILDAPQHLHDELLVRWVEQISERYEDVGFRGDVLSWLCAGGFPPSSVMAGYMWLSAASAIGVVVTADIPVRGCVHSSIG